MLVVFPPIFMADTKIIYGYNFVAPLNMAVRIYDSSWKDDLYLMQQLKEHNSKMVHLQEILSYMNVISAIIYGV